MMMDYLFLEDFDKSNVDYENDCHAIEKALTQFTTIKIRQS